MTEIMLGNRETSPRPPLGPVGSGEEAQLLPKRQDIRPGAPEAFEASEVLLQTQQEGQDLLATGLRFHGITGRPVVQHGGGRIWPASQHPSEERGPSRA